MQWKLYSIAKKRGTIRHQKHKNLPSEQGALMRLTVPLTVLKRINAESPTEQGALMRLTVPLTVLKRINAETPNEQGALMRLTVQLIVFEETTLQAEANAGVCRDKTAS